MGSRVRIRLFHILHFVRDLLFPLLKNSKSVVDDQGHRLRITHTPHHELPKFNERPGRSFDQIRYLKSLTFCRTAILEALRSHFAKIAHKVAKSKIFQKFKLNRNVQRIAVRMMYVICLCYVIDSQMNSGGALSHLAHSA